MRLIENKKGLAVIAILAVIAFFIILACSLSIMNGLNLGSSTANNGAYYSSDSSGSGDKQAPLNYPASYGAQSTSYYPATTTAPDQTNNVYTNVNDRKIIMTASVQIETSGLDNAVNAIRGIATGAGGYVESSSTWVVDNDKKQASVTIKVPQSAYEQSLSQIKAIGKVKSESSSGQDITRQYIDLNASLNNLRVEEQQLNSLMGMSKNVTEVLAVENELFRVRGEIQTDQAELNYLGSQVDFSTITVSVSEPQPVVGYDWGLDTAFREATHAFTGMIGALILLTGYLVPLILYIVIGLLVAYAVYKVSVRLYNNWKKNKEMKP